MATGDAWTEHEVSLLRKLWAEGKSGGECAKQLPGRSRNACIGVVHRIGLPLRSTAARPVKKRPKRTRAASGPSTPRTLAPRNMHVTRIKPTPAPVKAPNHFDASPASQAAAALLGQAYKREGLSL